jgi:hypothetical protein
LPNPSFNLNFKLIYGDLGQLFSPDPRPGCRALAGRVLPVPGPGGGCRRLRARDFQLKYYFK